VFRIGRVRGEKFNNRIALTRIKHREMIADKRPKISYRERN